MANRKQESWAATGCPTGTSVSAVMGFHPLPGRGTERQSHPFHNILLYTAFSIGAASSQLNSSWAICFQILIINKNERQKLLIMVPMWLSMWFTIKSRIYHASWLLPPILEAKIIIKR